MHRVSFRSITQGTGQGGGDTIVQDPFDVDDLLTSIYTENNVDRGCPVLIFDNQGNAIVRGSDVP